MNMKKFLAILLAIVMCFSMVACAGTPDAGDPTTDTAISDTVPEVSDPVEEETVVDEVVFNPVTLVSNDRVIFRVTSEPYRDDFWDRKAAENCWFKVILCCLFHWRIYTFGLPSPILSK